ncbi:hypothetical protein GF323_04190 [Candidatus Woesearchaeota archaeon]|nr:hypothetical protein [Candidatus Woesearchaeota archaeon]
MPLPVDMVLGQHRIHYIISAGYTAIGPLLPFKMEKKIRRRIINRTLTLTAAVVTGNMCAKFRNPYGIGLIRDSWIILRKINSQ